MSDYFHSIQKRLKMYYPGQATRKLYYNSIKNRLTLLFHTYIFLFLSSPSHLCNTQMLPLEGIIHLYAFNYMGAEKVSSKNFIST